VCLLLRVASSCLRKCDWGVEVLDAPELDTLLSFCADKVGLGGVSLLMIFPPARVLWSPSVRLRYPLGGVRHVACVVGWLLEVLAWDRGCVADTLPPPPPTRLPLAHPQSTLLHNFPSLRRPLIRAARWLHSHPSFMYATWGVRGYVARSAHPAV
jgi:hypothetical protein